MLAQRHAVRAAASDHRAAPPAELAQTVLPSMVPHTSVPEALPHIPALLPDCAAQEPTRPRPGTHLPAPAEAGQLHPLLICLAVDPRSPFRSKAIRSVPSHQQWPDAGRWLWPTGLPLQADQAVDKYPQIILKTTVLSLTWHQKYWLLFRDN